MRFVDLFLLIFFFFLRHHALEFTPSPHPLPACRLKESRSAPPPPPTSRRAGGAPAWDRLPAPVREELVRQDFQIWTGRVQFGPHTSAPHDTAECIKLFLVGCDWGFFVLFFFLCRRRWQYAKKCKFIWFEISSPRIPPPDAEYVSSCLQALFLATTSVWHPGGGARSGGSQWAAYLERMWS